MYISLVVNSEMIGRFEFRDYVGCFFGVGRE
jgi:hypothetical protein